jgi:hypothetical protein
MTTLEELEKLLTGLRAIVASYEKKNPLRTADFHGEGCSCHRCAVDGCSAAINALPGLIESARRVGELEGALAELADKSELMLNQGDDGGYTEQTANSVAIRIDSARAALKGT